MRIWSARTCPRPPQDGLAAASFQKRRSRAGGTALPNPLTLQRFNGLSTLRLRLLSALPRDRPLHTREALPR
jgi:hypothetical protein